MSTQDVYYKLSGKAPLASTVAVLGGMGTMSVVLGAVYGMAVFYIPIVYLNVLLTLGMAFGVGWGVLSLGKMLKVRSALVLAVVALVCGLAAEYAACAGWIYAVTQRQHIVIDPATVWRALQYFAEDGVWSLRGGTPVKGAMLYTTWGIEALIIVGGAMLVPWILMEGEVFCEACSQWVKEKTTLSPFAPLASADVIKTQLEQGDFGVLDQLKAVPEGASHYTEFALARCTGCDDLHLMTMTDVKLSVDKEGKLERNESHVIRNLIIDAESRELLLEILKDRPQEEPDEPETADRGEDTSESSDQQASDPTDA